MLKKDFFIPVHPGEVLQNILDDSGITQTHLALHLGIPHSKINEICRGKRGISAEMAAKLGKAFGQSPAFWMNLQKNWELSQVDKSTYQNIKKLASR